jgi:lipopolysaccharide/colanic/teichoic acid biosynthesis glycosyltransferase
MSSSDPILRQGVLDRLYLWRAGQNRRVKMEGAGRGKQVSRVPEPYFLQSLRQERRRAERSGKHVLLMLLDGETTFALDERMAEDVTKAVARVIRQTDRSGWYRPGLTVGVIFTELTAGRTSAAQEVLRARVEAELRAIHPQGVANIRLTFHLFPETAEEDGRHFPFESSCRHDRSEQNQSRQRALFIKRVIDVVGCLVALTLLSPLLLIIAAGVKLTSEGTVLYRQVRVGHRGRRFTFLKFRSMYIDSNPQIHQEFVRSLIRGEAKTHGAKDVRGGVHKITRDPRVTSLGRVLRKTSLDELPQLFNVLKGEMSLVGPRPPIPYELQSYDHWHLRRVLEAKPGVTGLWQVSGRSMTTFDEMVRLDLQYAKSWSLLLDLKILWRTPRAVISGEGAY